MMPPVGSIAPADTAVRKTSFLFLYPTALSKVTQDLLAWLDDCNLKGHTASRELKGAKLAAETRDAIDGAFNALLLYGPNQTPPGRQVGEILEIAAKRKDGFKVWPVLLDGFELPIMRRPGSKEFKARALPLSSGALSKSAPAFLGSLIPNWTRANFLAHYWLIDQYVDAGQSAEAVPVARECASGSAAATKEAYTEAAFDVPLSKVLLGRVLELIGARDEAREYLTKALSQIAEFAGRDLGPAPDSNSGAFLMLAEAMLDMRMSREAAKLYVDAIRAAATDGNALHTGIAKGQLAQVRVAQDRHDEALALSEQAVEAFRALDDPNMLRRAFEQLGAVRRTAGKLDDSLAAYREAYALGADAALCRTMANLCARMEMHSEAADYASRRVQLAAPEDGIVARLEAAKHLAKAGRIDEARSHVAEARGADAARGEAAEPWRISDAVHRIEKAAGNIDAAAEARRTSLDTFLHHRRTRGDNNFDSGNVTNQIVFAIAGGSTEAARRQLEATLLKPGLTPGGMAFFGALLEVVNGSRDTALADHPELEYHEAAEILILIEALT